MFEPTRVARRNLHQPLTDTTAQVSTNGGRVTAEGGKGNVETYKNIKIELASLQTFENSALVYTKIVLFNTNHRDIQYPPTDQATDTRATLQVMLCLCRSRVRCLACWWILDVMAVGLRQPTNQQQTTNNQPTNQQPTNRQHP